MAIDKKDAKVTRLDLRIPNEIYAQVEEIAKVNNAPSHHISGNIILSPTLLKLISLGIRSLSGNYSELDDISQPSDTSSTRIDAIAGELAEVKKSLSELSDKLSGIVSDTIPDIVPDTIPDSKEGEVVLTEAIAPTPSQTDEPSYGGIPVNVEIPSANPDPKPEPKPIPKPVTGLGGEEMSYGAFFIKIGLEKPVGRNIANARLALDRADELDMTGWDYDSVNSRFYRKPPTE